MSKAYFLNLKQYVQYEMDPATEGVEAGYPRPIVGNWPGLEEAFEGSQPIDFSSGGPDSAILWNNGKAYFFRGEEYVRYTMDPAREWVDPGTMDPVREGVDPGYPKPIAGNWPGLAEAFALTIANRIDAAIAWGNGKAYFFSGDRYVRYEMDPAREGVDPGYPKPIAGNWPGLAEALPIGPGSATATDGIDCAVVWNNGKAYFFKGDRYVRYEMDPAREGVDPGYPKPIAGNWPGLAEAFPLLSPRTPMAGLVTLPQVYHPFTPHFSTSFSTSSIDF
jgi:hypothetical protein